MAQVNEIITIRDLKKSYKRRPVLDIKSLSIPEGSITGIIGPDGSGKSTLLKAITGVMKYKGSVLYKGQEVRDNPEFVKSHLSYMPQGIGYNLYMDMTVEENIKFFAELRKIDKVVYEKNAVSLLKSLGLWQHRDKLASHLSGGMKQKLGLACSLVSEPELVVLDEPSTGIDPLSRRQLWQVLTERLRGSRTTVLFATSYLDEAERADRVVFLHKGDVLFDGRPEDVLREEVSLEEYFFKSLKALEDQTKEMDLPPFAERCKKEAPIVVEGVTKTFGRTEALRDVSLRIEPAEIFGLLGPNGAGKTTLIKCILGLVRPDRGTIRVLGLEPNSKELMFRVGYMSQIFSLYNDLTVTENILLYGRIYQVPDDILQKRLQWVLEFSGLSGYADEVVKRVPLGMKQRLALGVATVHMPEVLFLDEPTSGVDPHTRKSFWDFINKLSRELNITVVVTTHNLIEADFCDRVAIMNEGEIVALSSPEQLKREFVQKHGTVYEVKTTGPIREELLKEKGLQVVPFGRRYHIWGKGLTDEVLREHLHYQGLGIDYLKQIPPPMEDIFIEAIM
ncbi:MAG: ABC transporter ATP-binding protein [Nitrospirae bacterium]|nr:MAG: ABC transporter ATP-binding protein [Nitrospirota bacterium]